MNKKALNPGPPPSPHNDDLAAASDVKHHAKADKDESGQVSDTQESSKRETLYNIVFILTDQERYMEADALPQGYHLPGRERLKKRGVNFTNHQIASAVCTSSRSVIYTGLHMPNTKMFDNLDFPWAYALDKDIGTIGQQVGESGYYAAYKGKWHLSSLGEGLSEKDEPDSELTQVIGSYGFNDYVGIGDVIGMVQGGWINDDLITAQSLRWLRVHGNPMNNQNVPWLLAINLVNPHDVMFFNTDDLGEHVQDTPVPLIGLSREPNTPFYNQQWDIKLPKSRHESFDKEGRPTAHLDYQISRDTQVGTFPNEDKRWTKLLNYYHNCILSTDNMVVRVLDEIESLGLSDNTIVILTSDHGELGGGHANHGKGATAYQEQNHVPLIISHPGYPDTQGQDCKAVTSHLDIASTINAWTQPEKNVTRKQPKFDKSNNQYSKAQKRQGKDLTKLLELGARADVNEIREGALYCFNMFAYLDRDFMPSVQAYLNEGGDPDELGKQNFRVNLDKRGAIRSIVDGRYRFTRYFSPKQHNQPSSLDEIFELNDVELFDLDNDPNEMDNLAVDRDANKVLILKMNDKLNRLIDEEINGADDGGYLPFDNAVFSHNKFHN